MHEWLGKCPGRLKLNLTLSVFTSADSISFEVLGCGYQYLRRGGNIYLTYPIRSIS